MTVSSENYRNQYEGNGVTTTFAYAYKILTDADLLVIKTGTTGTETTLVLDTHYSVTDAGEATGSISYPLTGTKLAADEYITLTRHMDITQTTDLNNQGGFYPATVEGMADKNLMLIQQVQEEVDRCPKLTEGTTEDSGSYLTVIQAAETAAVAAAVDTAADVVLTNADVLTTAASAAAALVSENAAAASAAKIPDYEEGTFTPVSDGTATYTNQCGEYTLVGKVVTCSFNLIINAIGTGSPYYIWGFPFTAKNSSLTQAGTIGYGISMATNSTGLNCYISSNTTRATLTGQNGSAPTFGTMALLGDSTQISGSITYIVE